jgi:hypothetical protein
MTEGRLIKRKRESMCVCERESVCERKESEGR